MVLSDATTMTDHAEIGLPVLPRIRGPRWAEADLTGADLAGHDLVLADLRRAKLAGANLRAATLDPAPSRGGARGYKAPSTSEWLPAPAAGTYG